MPTSPNPDDTPAWIKGDLPADPSANVAKPEAGETAGRPDGPDEQATQAVAELSDEAGEASVQPEPPRPEEPDEDETTAEPALAGDEERVATSELDPPALAAETDVAEAPTVDRVAAAPEVASDLPVEPETVTELEVAPALNSAEAAPHISGVAADRLEAGQPMLADSAKLGPASAERAPSAPDSPAELAVERAEPVLPVLASAPEPVPAIDPPVVELLSTEALIESLLFVADGAVPIARLAEALEVPNREIESALIALSEGYRLRGLSLQRFRDKVQLTTSPSAAAKVERFLGLAAATPLSRAALEALAIVAYQQPVTRPKIEAVRGVNSDSVIKNLLIKGLIEESGRAEGPGRPVLYSTTTEFMQHFGLASLADLPPLTLPNPDGAANPQRILKG